ncbi:MAG: glucose-1-phosphate thymidylyltransferase [Bacteroidetes bacterium]|nr:glucose-1-phosphate thymidylyltransferase [Bacteroidota bacterium]
MRLYLFDLPSIQTHLWPFTLTRSAADIQVGMFSLRQKWQALNQVHILGHFPSLVSSWSTYDSIAEASAFPLVAVASHCFPTTGFIQQLQKMAPGQTLWQGNALLAIFAQSPSDLQEKNHTPTKSNSIQVEKPVDVLDRIWKIPELIGREIQRDLAFSTPNRTIPKTEWGNLIIGPAERLHLADGATVYGSIINTTQGDVFLDSDSEVMEGCMIRGPFYLGKHSCLKMGTRIYGPVATGVHVKLGGEINQSQIFDYSNKGHEGYLGNSVIGSWCNLGADTNNSNLKNNYAEVKLWNQALSTFENTGLQFCGLFMGDHSKTGINTMFNTGTVVGFSCNIFGSGFPRNVIPSFRWGGASGVIPYKLEAAKETAKAMMARRKIKFDEVHENMFQSLFNQEKPQ